MFDYLRKVARFPISILICNLILIYLIYTILKIVFIVYNYDYYQSIEVGHYLELFKGALRFDTSAIFYSNLLYIVLILLPCHFQENKAYSSILKWIYILPNSLAIVMNLMDTVYFPYSKQRTTYSVFEQFENENNISSIIFTEIINSWYIVLIAIVLIYILIRFYKDIYPFEDLNISKSFYYTSKTIILLVSIPFIFWALRGVMFDRKRPISINEANEYVDNPNEIAIVLNTTFSFIRTIGKKPFSIPNYFPTLEEAERVYSPIHKSQNNKEFNRKNVVVLILESFGKEYWGYFNKNLEGGKYKGYTPFLDSLASESWVFENTFANGQKSIDAMPSVLASMPNIKEPIFLTNYSANEFEGLADILSKEGYHTAFFHGAPRGSMAFLAFSRNIGFSEYYGQEDYGNDDDSDNYWGIWDEEFLQYMNKKMTSFKEPFLVSMFSLTSHHPFIIPDKYKEKFKGGDLDAYRGIQYTDNALRLFFEAAKKEAWYNNTIFAITGDHINKVWHREYFNSYGDFAVPVLFYTPDESLKGHEKNKIVQQIDIMPTILSYLGYNKDYIAYGQDLTNTSDEDSFAINERNGVYQIFKGDYLIRFDGKDIIAVYKWKTDIFLENNLKENAEINPKDLDLLKAFIQSYFTRMVQNKVSITNN